MLGLRGKHVRGFLPVGGIKLAQIARDALLELCPASLYLGSREVLARLLTALNLLPSMATLACANSPISRQSSTKGAHFPEPIAIVLAEVGKRLVVWNKPAKQPHRLEVAASFAFEPAARLHPIAVAVDAELQKDRGMIGRPPRCFGINPVKPKFGEMKCLNERLDDAYRIVPVDPLVQAFRPSVSCPRFVPSMNRFSSPRK